MQKNIMEVKDKTKVHIKWNEIENTVNKLCFQLSRSERYIENICGIQRGGLIPAVMISHKLGIPMVKTPSSPDTLVIDDICDTGETLKNIFERYQTEYSFPFHLQTASLFYKPHTSIFKPTFYAVKFESDDWLVYPWEKTNSKTIQDYKI